MSAPDRRVIFHAGFHKTGTTSLQTALHLHAARLSPQFAIHTRSRSPTLREAADAARALSVSQTPVAVRDLEDSLHHWAASLPPDTSHLVSCEDFAGHMPGHPGVADYRTALPVAAAIRRALHHHLPGHRLCFLFTLRDAAPWLRALHWQLSRHDDLTLGPRRFARAYAGAADFAPLLDALRAQMPDTPVRDANLADLATRRLGPVEALYDAAGLPDDLRATLPPPPRANPTPPHDLARVFVRLNRSDLPRAEIRRLKRDMLAAENLLLGEGDFFAQPIKD